MKRFSLIVGLVAVTLGATALPFIPGRHDVLAVPLSGFSRTLGMGSLLLVPIGLVWLSYEWLQAGDGKGRGRTGFIVVSLAAASIVVLAAALFAATLSGPVLAVGVLVAWGFALWRVGPRLLNWSRHSRGREVAPALMLVLVPGVVAGAQLALARPLTSLAWSHTMDGMEPLIADIERYRVANGHFPRSLFSEWMDYRPAVVGVAGYKYEPTGDAYSLAVEVPSFSFDSRKFLLYNPADAYVMTGHDADLLLRTAAELVHYRGYHSALALDRPHWRVLSFD